MHAQVHLQAGDEKAVKAVGKVLLKILNVRADQATIQKALDVLQGATSINNVSFNSNMFHNDEANHHHHGVEDVPGDSSND